MKTIENNKLIAEFMGMKKDNPNSTHYYRLSEGRYYSEDNLRYDTSWDWLMPVVYKIDIACGIDLNEWDEYINESLISKQMIPVYKSVVEFITWYNENKKA